MSNTVSWLFAAALACGLAVVPLHRSMVRWFLIASFAIFLISGFVLLLLGSDKTLAKTDKSTPDFSNNQGIITNNQSGGSNTINNYRPVDRSLTSSQSLALTNSLRGVQIPLLLMSLGDQEASAYAEQVFVAIRSSGVVTDAFSFGTMGPPPYGVQVFPNGNDAVAVESALNAASITFSISNQQLPVPYSVLNQYKDYVGLLVGLKSY